MKKFSSAQLGLAGDLDVLIPNSINRLRVKGAGSRFVHGGASLQEIVIPVLRVGKQREADIKQVEVQIIVSGRSLPPFNLSRRPRVLGFWHIPRGLCG